MRGARALAATAALGTAAVIPSCLPAAPVLDLGTCPPANVVVDAAPGAIPWPSSELSWDEPVTFDGTDATFSSGQHTDRAAVKLRTPQVPPGSCLLGGTVRSDVAEPDLSWDEAHHLYGVSLAPDDTTLSGTRIDHTGDAVSVSGERWAIDDAHVTDAHDDCVQADRMTGGRITRSLFERCHVFLSASNGREEIDGHENEIHITDTLVWVAPFEESYNPPKYGHGQHGPIFKVADGRHPRLMLERVTIRVDEPAAYGENVAGRLGLPAGSSCIDVTLIGTDAWPDAELATWVVQCMNLRLLDLDEWDRAVAAFLESR